MTIFLWTVISFVNRIIRYVYYDSWNWQVHLAISHPIFWKNMFLVYYHQWKLHSEIKLKKHHAQIIFGNFCGAWTFFLPKCHVRVKKTRRFHLCTCKSSYKSEKKLKSSFITFRQKFVLQYFFWTSFFLRPIFSLFFF